MTLLRYGHRDSGALQEQLSATVARAERAEQELAEVSAQLVKDYAFVTEADVAQERVRVLEEALREARSFINANTTHLNADANETLLRIDRALAAAAAPQETA